MRFLRSRRALLTAALATSALLASCGGGGRIESQFTPARGVLIEGAGTSWAQNVLSRYGSIPAVSVSGGPAYSLGAAPILSGNAAFTGGTLTLSQRVDAAVGLGLNGNDLVIVSAGLPDIADPAVDPTLAAQAMATQVRRLVTAGARHVLVANNYDVGLTPYAAGLAQQALYTTRTRTFNDALKIAMADLGASVLLIDLELYFNQLVASGAPGTGLTNGTAAVCGGSVIGTGTVSDAVCASGAFGGNNPAVYLFYDPLYLTVKGQELAGATSFNVLRSRW